MQSNWNPFNRFIKHIKSVISNNSNRLGLVISTVIMLLFLIYLGPIDGFTHGFFPNEINLEQIDKKDLSGVISLEQNYTMMFTPQKKHFAGFEIYLVQPDENTGTLTLKISDKYGRAIDSISVDLSKVNTSSWYRINIDAKLNKGDKYVLTFMANDYITPPCLQKINKNYLTDETLSGNILISYAYAASTFASQTKLIIFMFVIAIWVFICGFFSNESIKKNSCTIAIIILLTSVLTWNYRYNSMDNKNNGFSHFQEDSETLVTGMIYSEQDSESFKGEGEEGYGLGRYYTLKGPLRSYKQQYTSNDIWLNGYSQENAAIIVNSNIYSKDVAREGNSILFKNGQRFKIIAVEDDGTNIVIYLNSTEPLSMAQNGSLDDAVFYDLYNNKLPSGRITAYKSQFGLQGKIFNYMAKYFHVSTSVLNLGCCILTALIFSVIVLLIYCKYNIVLAGCFFTTFWLSPWIVNFARNLYWVEFTWFIPMAVGLFCSWKIKSKKCRIISYILAFIAIAGKCLCGYEYISTIMMGLISFISADLISAVINRDRTKSILLFRTIVILGLAALAGFAFAICIHARLRGDGNIIEGILDIFRRDVLRRTSGADMNEFSSVYWASFNASVWEVYCKYFHFTTEIITGLAGNLFPLLCIAPLCLLAYEYKIKKLDTELLAMYGIFFLTSISWFCLAKAHSYIHAHINYVLWYFGFVQICFYIIINKIVSILKIQLIKKEI